MYCPYCHKNAARVFKNGRVYCSHCDELLEDLPSKEKPALRCPRCKQYSRNDYCSICGYEFKEGKDY